MADLGRSKTITIEPPKPTKPTSEGGPLPNRALREELEAKMRETMEAARRQFEQSNQSKNGK